MSDAGRLIVVGTPIGNLGDLTDRARAALGEADGWLVEDTRVSGKLQSVLAIHKPMRVLNEHTVDAKIASFVEDIRQGQILAALTDAGMPSISDPGSRLVDLCREADLEVDAIPGASAVTTALALSGFYAQRFAFLGFLGRKPGAIREQLTTFAESPLTLVLFESPFRLDRLLVEAGRCLGERRYALCREMTKAHQQVYRDRLPMVPSAGVVPRKGELTVVFEGLRRGDREESAGWAADSHV
ncbi:MAG: 16S rRNA (cytidine(1402)-2'-O)-methyltransferase [Fimbriimonadaceae bacterium]|nr:16S rRNA (cytidine(1402)-2'-O)-methyltransferase [Fimbriimonadaceae bacterium]